MATTKLSQRVKEIVSSHSPLDTNPSFNEPTCDIPVLYISDELARIYLQNLCSKNEFSTLSPNARYCVGLQSPLLQLVPILLCCLLMGTISICFYSMRKGDAKLEGGLVLVGWSLGAQTLLLLFAGNLAFVGPNADGVLLEEYMKDVVFYGTSLTAFDYSLPPNYDTNGKKYYLPWLDPETLPSMQP
ncbi:hypothetical protein BT96DRAFT_999846 [Gymnopus androsaceus JB14]|uniref:Uncharacterized protein n=1 Tax=Gymnopus androsaceus JB14 TaxID=1447944 RepID=A0A6A4H4E9_9AGAR|nr:hypothetical protein BT96DRAFT_999846 [Gymnopus androsaceus JB14]